MTLHICRDFLAKHPTASTIYARYYNLYISSMFLRGVLGFTVVGQTNFNIDSGSITKGFGSNNANINVGAPPLDRAVQLPTGSYLVGVGDIDRVLALKSNNNPTLSSGLFRVSGIDSGSNSLILAARAWVDPPIAETGITWKLFESEWTVTAGFSNVGNANPTNQYHGDGSAQNSRIILQSPHATGWQLRVCAEAVNETDNGTNESNFAACTFAPGFSGTPAGDFPHAGQHLHHPMFYNLANTNSNDKTSGMMMGLGINSNSVPGRYYMWGDDQTGSGFILGRQHGGDTQGIVCFGIPEDEDQPVPNIIYRLFIYGQNKNQNIGSSYMYAGVQQSEGMLGSAFGLGNQPISCTASAWGYLGGSVAAEDGIMVDTAAADGIYVAATELETWDLIAGTWDFGYAAGQPSGMSLEPRRLGRLPFARHGRENFNLFSTSTDQARSWLHVGQGIYLPWSGSIVP